MYILEKLKIEIINKDNSKQIDTIDKVIRVDKIIKIPIKISLGVIEKCFDLIFEYSRFLLGLIIISVLLFKLHLY